VLFLCTLFSKIWHHLQRHVYFSPCKGPAKCVQGVPRPLTATTPPPWLGHPARCSPRKQGGRDLCPLLSSLLLILGPGGGGMVGMTAAPEEPRKGSQSPPLWETHVIPPTEGQSGLVAGGVEPWTPGGSAPGPGALWIKGAVCVWALGGVTRTSAACQGARWRDGSQAV